MKLKIFHLLFVLTPVLSFAQNWQWENPIPMGDEVQQVFFIDSLDGWVLPSDNGLLRTTDGGDTWEIIYTNVLFNNIYFISKDVGWGIGRKTFEQDYPRNIYYTTDGGNSWAAQLVDTSTSNSIDTCAFYNIYFQNRLNGWATTEDPFSPVLHTSNGGINWNVGTNVSFRLTDGGPFWVEFADSLRGWIVGGLKYSLKTLDGGKTWLVDSTLHGYKIASSDSNHLWILSNTFLTKSTDGGKNWFKVNFQSPFANMNTYDISVIDSNNVFVSSDSGLFKSSNGGLNWYRVSNEVLGSLWFLNDKDSWAGGTGYISDLFHSTDGGMSWSDQIKRNYPFGLDDYMKVDFVNQDTGWITTQSPSITPISNVMKTTDGGMTWAAQNITIAHWIRNIQMINGKLGFMIGDSGIIYKTTDGGSNWTPKNIGTNDDLMGISFINQNEGWIVGRLIGESTGIIIKTNNGGDTWVNKDTAIANLQDVCFIDSLKGWAAAYGDNFSGGRIINTTDGGKSWNIQITGSFTEVTFLDSLNGFALGISGSSSAHLYITHDGGRNWLPSSMITGSLQDMQFINRDTGYVVGFYGRIFMTRDAGKTWTQQQSYCNRYLYSVDFTDSNNGWVVGSAGTVLHTSNGGISFINDKTLSDKLPAQISLYQNYPNPFNPSTMIGFKLSTNSFTSLKVYDILGDLVKTLIEGYKNQGDYSINFNAEGLASGIYFYRLIANPINNQSKIYTVTRKMIYLK
jgi:photosystem II stability/assembly factor-like uncharacterized protein